KRHGGGFVPRRSLHAHKRRSEAGAPGPWFETRRFEGLRSGKVAAATLLTMRPPRGWSTAISNLNLWSPRSRACPRSARFGAEVGQGRFPCEARGAKRGRLEGWPPRIPRPTLVRVKHRKLRRLARHVELRPARGDALVGGAAQQGRLRKLLH